MCGLWELLYFNYCMATLLCTNVEAIKFWGDKLLSRLIGENIPIYLTSLSNCLRDACRFNSQKDLACFKLVNPNFSKKLIKALICL